MHACILTRNDAASNPERFRREQRPRGVAGVSASTMTVRLGELCGCCGENLQPVGVEVRVVVGVVLPAALGG
jgi:hypothetical protein